MTTKTVTEAAKELRQVVLRLLDSTDPDPSLPSAARARLDTYDALLAMRDAIDAAEGGDDRKDADRYRFMRDNAHPLEQYDYATKTDNGVSCYHMVDGVRELKSGAELDAAIDAAIAKERTS